MVLMLRWNSIYIYNSIMGSRLPCPPKSVNEAKQFMNIGELFTEVIAINSLIPNDAGPGRPPTRQTAGSILGLWSPSKVHHQQSFLQLLPQLLL